MAHAGFAFTERWPAVHPDILICGRFARADQEQGGQQVGSDSIRFDWPGTRIEFLCHGRMLILLLFGPSVHFDVYLNGERLESPCGNSAASVVTSSHPLEIPLPPADEVRVVVHQRSECVVAPVVFRGIELSGGELLGRPLSGPHTLARVKAEFVGDSYFVGYGNLLPIGAPQRDGLSAALVDAHTNTQQSMAALCGEKLHLDWRISAISGRGMVRNYGGDVRRAAESRPARLTLPECYPLPLHSDNGATNSCVEQFAPDLVVINLGTNDFSTPLRPGEHFRDARDLELRFLIQYRKFLLGLHRRFPNVKLLLVGVPHPDSPQQTVLLKQLALALQNLLPVAYCQLPSVALSGCDAHPGLMGHHRCAEALATDITRLLAK